MYKKTRVACDQTQVFDKHFKLHLLNQNSTTIIHDKSLSYQDLSRF